MINTKTMAVILGVAAAITLSSASAEAGAAHERSAVHGVTLRGAHAEQRSSYSAAHNHASPSGSSFFAEPNGPDNYNPNEG